MNFLEFLGVVVVIVIAVTVLTLAGIGSTLLINGNPPPSVKIEAHGQTLTVHYTDEEVELLDEYGRDLVRAREKE